MPSNMTAIWILFVTFCLFLLLRFPVALVLVISSIATLWYLDMPIVVVAQQTLQGINQFSLLAIPFFILTGQLLGAGGLATRIVDFANVFVGRLPGGLSIVNSVACMFFGNLSGSAVADALACPFAAVSPEMVYRSLYFVTNAVAQDPTTDPVRYLADHARELGIIKRPRKKAPHERPPTPPVYPLTINQMA